MLKRFDAWRSLRVFNSSHEPWLLLLAVLIAYGNALQGVFQFDDYPVIVNYPTVHSLSAWWADVGHGLRPLLKFTYTLNWASGGGETGFHLVNLGLHFAASLLVYRIALYILPELQKAALITALLFAVHPAASEAVTYISGRSTSLMTVFYLVSLLAYVQGTRENKISLLYFWSPLFFIFATTTKETALLLPFSLLLWDSCFEKPFKLRAMLKRQAIHWMLFLIMAITALFSERYWQMMMYSTQIHPLQTNFLTQLHALTYMLGQLLVPLRMNIDPDLPVISEWNQATPDLVQWLGLTFFALLNWRKRPWICFAVLWFVLLLLPVYVFLPRLDVVNDRHLYPAGWALLLPVAVLLEKLGNGFKFAGVAGILILLAGSSISRNLDYRSEIALWESTARLSPNKSRVQNNLGYAYFLAGRWQDAERAYLKAIELDAGNQRARNNLVVLRHKQTKSGKP